MDHRGAWAAYRRSFIKGKAALLVARWGRTAWLGGGRHWPDAGVFQPWWESERRLVEPGKSGNQALSAPLKYRFAEGKPAMDSSPGAL